MDSEKFLYNTQTYNAAKAFFYAFPAFVMLVALVMIIAINIHSEVFGVIGWILALSIPFLFQKGYKKLFTRRVELEFDGQGVLIKEYAIKKDVLVKEITVYWAEIQFYRVSFSSSNMVYLVLYLGNGSTKRFSFKDEKNQEQALNSTSVFSVFYFFVKQYNLDKQPENNITLKPGFLTTKSGVLLLYSVAVLAVAVIIVHFILAPNTFLLSFMSFFIIMGLLVKRKTDRALYDKISLLKPRSPFD